MSVSVKYGRDKLSFAIPDQNTPFSAIRQALADHTGLPYDGFKLIHKGAVIKDNNAPIYAYHIVPGSVLQLIPTAVPNEPQQHPHHHPSTSHTTADEKAVLSTIQSEVASVRSKLAPDLRDLLSRISRYPNEKTPEPDRKECLRLGELLLQSLLRLDGIAPDRDWEQARGERKAAVKEVQGLLDALDDTVAARRAAGLHN
ncbi:hypothetical protein BKA70DRAFT_1261142 [Coprinopsis sp. MPI-PUGE-AT-0042]|nr:hypothetical protein BKA70DRAFT_1261142 [Coprinopsis sp. MPI-PUGE-AT-0042]